MLKLNNVSVNYGAFTAVKNVDIEVHPGEIVVLLGSNGAGKSTTFNSISGLNKPSSGEILYDEQNIVGFPPDQIVNLGIIQCAEGRNLFPGMTVQENLMMGGYVHRKNKIHVKERLEEVYEMFPILKEKHNESAGSLSGGQQQMVAIGRALMGDPQYMLLDEPSIGLAPLIVEQMFAKIKQINDGGTSILLAEQNANAALKIADRGYVFENGQIAVQGTAEELLTNEEVRKAYIGA
ncbi:ABC transporter ATP-binding protein [Piscibacillus halophilus]|uniref:Amino acid/amide ABC transporter ATP-binding protein 2, HAAT family n=1 Tax=Piscibacillus halophilus TaxID=571933 RepID=A0A1H9HIR5_9BACI|nr:ABC transporter ATP-binding protein [Piscibacillus halophilus]SEQ62194.1 amino acid/amide ABC transporter ATP-binding protein 2, HAAT family [Piscibacillus halophilus]